MTLGGGVGKAEQGFASMRPRLIAVDDHDLLDVGCGQLRASMRPRLIAVDDHNGTYAPRDYETLQ